MSGGDTRAAIEAAFRDRRLVKARPHFFGGGIDAASHRYDSDPSPDLIVIETDRDPDAIFAALDGLARVCRRETHLVLIGAHNDIGLYRALTRQGVGEYLTLPIRAEQVLDAVLTLAADPEAPRLGRLVACIGASGGAGSTTIANNLAWSLAQRGDGEAILVDLDFAFGSSAVDFNLDSAEDASRALAQADRLDDQVLNGIIGRYNDNLGVLTAPGDCSRPADIDPVALETMLRRLRQSAARVIADLPHYWGAWVCTTLDEADEIVLTSVPTLASLRNARAVLDALEPRRSSDAPVRVVLNHVGANPKTDIPLRDFAATLGRPLAASLPHEPAIFAAASNAGRMLGESTRAKAVLEPLERLAVAVAGRGGGTDDMAAKDRGFLARLRHAAARVR